MLYLGALVFRVTVAFYVLLSFLAEQGYAYTVEEDNRPIGIAERLERLELEFKAQKQTIETLTKAGEEQMLKIKSLEAELDRMRAGDEQWHIPMTENATYDKRAGVGMKQFKEKCRQQRLLLDDMDASPVGFTAYLDHNTPNLGINQIIVFNRVLFNEGSAYNNLSGMSSIEMVNVLSTS